MASIKYKDGVSTTGNAVFVYVMLAGEDYQIITCSSGER